MPRLRKYESMTRTIDKWACPCSNHNGRPKVVFFMHLSIESLRLLLYVVANRFVFHRWAWHTQASIAL